MTPEQTKRLDELKKKWFFGSIKDDEFPELRELVKLDEQTIL